MIMSVIQFWILFLVCHFICGAPDGISKRAQSHSLPRASSNFSNVQRHSDNTSAKPVVIETAVSAVGVKEEICPSHLVPHNVGDATICCVPVFNCPVDHGIISCEKDGETDQCRQCPPGMVQKNNVSSLNMEEAHCYSEINTRNCMLDDTKPSRKISEVTSCPLWCECKNEECWHGKDPCACHLGNRCPINCTMNRETGECEKCPWFSYKDYVGCGTCTVIPEKWRVRNEHPATPVDPCSIKKTTVEESTEVTILEPTVVQNNDLAIGLAVVAVVAVVIVFVVLIVIFLRRRRKNADRNRHNEQDDLELDDNAIVHELQDGYETAGGRQKIVPKAHNRVGDNEHIAFEELGAVGGGEAPVDNNHMDRDDGFENEQNILDENDVLHENVSLLERGSKQTKNIFNPALGSNKLSEKDLSELSPLLNDFRNELGETEAKGGARQKVAPCPHNGKSKLESSILMEKYKERTYLDCDIDNNARVIPIAEQSSLNTDDSSDFCSTAPSIDMPVNVRTVSNIVVEKRRQAPFKEEKGDKTSMRSVLEESMKGEINDFADYTTTDTNGCKISEEKNAYGEKHMHINESNVRILDRLTESKLDNSELEVQNIKENRLDTSICRENKQCKCEKTGTENDDNTTIPNDVCVEGTISQELLADRKIMMKKEEQPDSDRCSSSSEGDIDNHKSDKRKINFGCSSNSGKPTAVVGPVRLNSVPQNAVQESSQGILPARIQNSVPAVSFGSQDDQQARLRRYMESLGPDAYPLLHANDPPDDISNFGELNPETISSNNELFSESPENEEGNLSSPREQSQGPAKSSIPQALNGDNYVQRSDLQRTFSKNEKEDNNVADTVARNRNEETFLKTPVQDPASDTSDKNIVCKTENSESESDMDENDVEKRKNSEAAIDADLCAEKMKEVDGDAQDANKKGHKVEKSDTLVQTASSENDRPVETVAETDNVELSPDCMATAADSSSVEMYLVNSLQALDVSVSTEDKTGDTVSGNGKNGDSES